MSRFHRAIAVITIVASAVFLLCIMLLKVEERRMDAAVMRFVGVRRRTIFGALLLEAALVAVAGSLVGTVLAFAAGAATNAYYRRFFDTALTFSLITPISCCSASRSRSGSGLAAGAAAAWRLVHTPAAGALGPGMRGVAWGLKSLRRQRLRTALSLAGIAVAAAMLLDMVMLSGGIDKSFADLLLWPGLPDAPHAQGHAAVRHRGHDGGCLGHRRPRSGAILPSRRPARCSARRCTGAPPIRP